MNKRKCKFRSKSGITLIALVISIIVMLILAGVSLNATVGENGIITKAASAKTAYEDSVWYENAETSLLNTRLSKEEIELLTDEEQNYGYSDEEIEILKKDKMINHLKESFTEFSKDDNVIVSPLGDGFIVVCGDRSLILDNELSITSSKTEKMLVSTGEDWEFIEAESGYAVLRSYKLDLSGVVSIPNIVTDKDSGKAYMVNALGNDIFNYATRITGIDFSKVNTQLKTIGDRAFAFCNNLNINVPNDLPSSIEKIGDKAFYGCTNLNGNINSIMSRGIALGKGVFMKCPNLTGSIQEIFNQNFFIDPETGNPNATVINDSEFSGYSGLTGSLTIPKYITKIGDSAFFGCTSISSLNFENDSQCNTIGNYAFTYDSGISNSLVIPNSVTTIGSYAFAQTGITGLQLSNTLSSMGIYAFEQCKALSGTLVIPTTLSIIPQYAFQYINISNLNFAGPGCTTISDGAFTYSSVKNITTIGESRSFPSTLTTIGSSAFRCCYGLETISFPNSLKTINNSGFWSDTNLIISQWSNSLEKIGGSSFISCKKIEILPDRSKLKTIESNAFNNCTKLGYNGGAKTDIIQYLQASIITSIGGGAFTGCSNLVGNFTGTINNSATPSTEILLSGSPFQNTAVVRSAILANNATTIASKEFMGVTSLTYNGTNYNNVTGTLTLPSTITSIGSYAFYGCTAFNKIIIPSSVTSIGSYAFAESNIKNIEFSNESNITKFPDYMCYKASVTSINIPSKVTTIGTGCFSQSYLATLNIPSNVTTIGSSCFSWSSMKNLTLNEGLKTINSAAFCGTQIVNITLPDSVTSIGSSLLWRCSKLESIIIGKGISIIPNNFVGYPLTGDGWNGNGILKSVTIRGNITTISSYAFCKNPLLNTITGIEWNNIDSIGEKAFYNDSALTGNITLKANTSIREDSFEGCGLIISK